MSTFKVTVERLEKVWDHPNADKLQLAKVEGMSFQFCVKKDAYKTGDLVIYFPVDAVLPPNLIEKFGIANFLAGKEKNRLKTVRLRGEISQGFVCSYSLPDIGILYGGRRFQDDGVTPWTDVGLDLTSTLGVTKYEAPEVPCHAANLIQHPEGITHYDIEGCQRYPHVLETLMDQPVFITEKVEGSNAYFSVLSDGKFVVGQRNFQIQQIEGHVHTWWKAAITHNIEDALRHLREDNYGKQVTIRAEICGPAISGNIYKLGVPTLFVFDILVDGTYLDAHQFVDTCTKYNLRMAPILSIGTTLREWLSGRTVESASSGQSTIVDFPQLKEGIVIKPMTEQFSSTLGGRLFLKMRDPIYLDKTGN